MAKISINDLPPLGSAQQEDSITVADLPPLPGDNRKPIMKAYDTAMVAQNVLMDFVGQVNKTAIGGLDFLIQPFDNVFFGDQIPDLEEALSQEPGSPGYTGHMANVAKSGNYGTIMEEQLFQDAVKAAAMLVPAAGALTPVKRSLQGGNILADVLGFGATEMTQGARMAAMTQEALSTDKFKLGHVILSDDEEIYEAANLAAKRSMIGKNRMFMSKYEKTVNKILKESYDKDTKTYKIPLRSSDEYPEGAGASLDSILKDLQDIHGVDPKDTLRILRQKGGIKVARDPIALDAMDTQMGKAPKTLVDKGKNMSWWDHISLPAADVLRKYISPKVGGFFERAIETSTRRQQTLLEEIGSKYKPLFTLVEESDKGRDLKRAMLDMHLDPVKNMKIARAIVKSELGNDGVKMFDGFMKFSDGLNSEALRTLYKIDEGFDDVHFIHAQNLGSGYSFWRRVGEGFRAKSETLDAVRDRKRGSAWNMSDASLDHWANPFMSHTTHLVEQEQLKAIAKQFNMRPSLGVGDSTNVFFKELGKKLEKEGFSELAATTAQDIMHKVHMGSKNVTPPMMRAFMNLSYAGTLSQPKSAVLNFHDVFVSALNNGVRATLKSLPISTKREFGKGLLEMGMDGQTEEFFKQFDYFMQDPTLANKAADWSRKVSDTFMTASGFRIADQTGKGILLRSSVNKMRQAAKDGKLYQQFSDVADKTDLKKIRRYLQEGTKVGEMPEDVARIVEEIAFTKLGQQQLISQAGRPMFYLQHPHMRPIYALTGFAIKQQAMLRKNVLWQIKQGNVSEAAKYMALYTAYAGLGYGIIDTARTATFRNEETEPMDLVWGTLEQLGAVTTLNRVGDPYSFSKFSDNPVQFIVESLLPPLGLTGAAGKDVSTALASLFNGEELNPADLKLLQSLPIIGDAIKYGWIDVGQTSPKDRGTKTERWDDVL